MKPLVLQIIQGYPLRQPGSPDGAYQSTFRTLNLLQAEGFSLKQDSWIPQIAQLKGGGVWADSNASDGRQLLAATYGNVVETMTLTVTGVTPNARHILEKLLHQFAQAAREFHARNYQIDPVYLMWWAEGAPGPQYALIYNIAVANNHAASGSVNANEVAISIEREPGWRGLPPGDDPTLAVGSDYGWVGTASNPALTNYTKTYGTADNSIPAVYCTEGFVTVPADQVPGDMPALCHIEMAGRYWRNTGETLAGVIGSVIIGRRSRLNAIDLTDGDTILHSNMLSVRERGDYTKWVFSNGPVGAGTAYTADNGLVDNDNTSDCSGSNPFRVDVNLSSVPGDAVRFAWELRGIWAGRYNVYARIKQGTGALGDVIVYLTYGDAGDERRTLAQTLPLDTVAAHNEFWPLVYLGVIDTPVVDSPVSPRLVDNSVEIEKFTLTIKLRAQRVAGTTATFALGDLILVPIDECALRASFDRELVKNPATYNPEDIFIDNTGYLSHGGVDTVAIATDHGDVNNLFNPELSGQPITLQPGVENRLYMVMTMINFNASPPWPAGMSSLISLPATDQIPIAVPVNVYIVPRWSGVRDA